MDGVTTSQKDNRLLPEKKLILLTNRNFIEITVAALLGTYGG